MMQRFVINLVSRPDRLAHMQSEFDRMGLDFRHFSALSIDDIAARGIVSPVMKGGILACTCSHISVAALAANADDDYTLVCEDDVWFSDDASRFLASSDWIPAGADLVKLETFQMAACIDLDPIAEFAGHSLHQLLTKHLGGAAYIMSRRYATQLASIDLNNLTAPIDSILFEPRWLSRLHATALQLTPAIAIQEFKLADADGVRLASNIDGSRKAARAARYRGAVGSLRFVTRNSRARLKEGLRYLTRRVTLRGRRWRLMTIEFGPRAARP